VSCVDCIEITFDYKFSCELSKFGYLYLLCDLIQNAKFNANCFMINEKGDTNILFDMGISKRN